MSGHTKRHLTKQDLILVTIKIASDEKKSLFFPLKSLNKLKAILEENACFEEKSVPWKVAAKERLEKYKKAGLVLRGARYQKS